MVRLQRPTSAYRPPIVLNTFRHDGTARPTSARVAEMHTIRALPIHMAHPSNPTAALSLNVPRPPSTQRPYSARTPHSPRPISAQPTPTRPGSSPQTRSPRVNRFVKQDGSPAFRQSGAGASLGTRALDSAFDAVPTENLAPAPASSAFLTEPRLDSPPPHATASPAGGGLFSTIRALESPASHGRRDSRDDASLPPVNPRTDRQKRKAALEALLALSAEEYVDLSFEASSYSLFENDDDDDDKTMNAAREFDSKHKRWSSACRAHLISLEYAPDSLAHQRGYDRRLLDLRRNRYFVREHLGVAKGIKPKRRRKPKWRLETSCWAERAKSGNSKDFFETSDALRRMFDIDWGIAARAHELSWYIVKCQNDPSTWRDLDRDNAFGEVEEVREALWQHHRLVYGAYDYYSCLYSDMEVRNLPVAPSFHGLLPSPHRPLFPWPCAISPVAPSFHGLLSPSLASMCVVCALSSSSSRPASPTSSASPSTPS